MERYPFLIPWSQVSRSATRIDTMKDTIYYSPIPTPIGTVTACSNGDALTALHLSDVPVVGVLSPNDPVLKRTAQWLEDYFSKKQPDTASIPLLPSGTPFQMLVWEQIRMIPYGKSVTYGQIAKTVAAKLGKEKMSAQAVGGAVGANPIPIIVPCHRVLGADTRLTGFTGGIEKKILLLELEGVPYKKLSRW